MFDHSLTTMSAGTLLNSLPSSTGHHLHHLPLAPCLRHGTHHPRPHALKAQQAWRMCRHRNNKRKFTWDGHAACSYARDDDDPPDAVADESMSPEGGDDDSDTKELTSPSAAVLDDEASDTRGLSMEPRGFPEDESEIEEDLDDVDGFGASDNEADDVDDGPPENETLGMEVARRRSRKQQDLDNDEDMQGMPEEAPLTPDAMHTEGIAMDLDAIIAEEELAAQGPLAGVDVDQFRKEDQDASGQPEEDMPPSEPSRQYPELPKRKMRLSDLLKACNLTQLDEEDEAFEGLDEIVIEGLQSFSHKVLPNDLYIHDGVLEEDPVCAILQAQALGAAAVISMPLLSEQGLPLSLPDMDIPCFEVGDVFEVQKTLAQTFYEHPSERMLTVGVTGTHGKTTTSWMIRGILEEPEQPGDPEGLVGMIGSLEYAIHSDRLDDEGEIWLPKTSPKEDPSVGRPASSPFYLTPYEGKYEHPDTTPDAVTMQKVLASIADRGATAAVVELDPIKAFEEGRGHGVHFNVLAWTGMQEDKNGWEEALMRPYGLDHKRVGEALVDAQGKLFRAMTDKDTQRAVIRADDPYTDSIKQCITVPTVTYALRDREADVYVTKFNEQNIWGTDLEVRTPFGLLNIFTDQVGKQNVYNILCAVATGLALGTISLTNINAGIEATAFVPGSLQLVEDPEQQFAIRIDSANTPDQLSRLLDAVRDSGARRIILVTGCPGSHDLRDRDLRPRIGEMAHYKADIVILTNNNPRTEDPSGIVADIQAGYPNILLQDNDTRFGQPYLQDIAWMDHDRPYMRDEWEEKGAKYGRWVMEDRFTAIRFAIAAALPRDVVVIAGKGAEEFQEYCEEDMVVKGWFNDEVEARNALANLPVVQEKLKVDRSEVIWGRPPGANWFERGVGETPNINWLV